MMAKVSSRAHCKGRASTPSLRVNCQVRMSCPRAMIFGNANSFSVSGNLCPDFGMAFMHQRHEIRRSQFANAAAQDFCLEASSHLKIPRKTRVEV
jgi:hypothetical protein